MSSNPLSIDQREQFIADVREREYHVLGQLGQGGMGTVFSARHGVLQRTVALKAIHPQLISRPDAQRRFIDEMRTMAKLNHPGIVAVYDGAITDHNVPFFAMELIGGETLEQYIAQRPQPLSLEETVNILRPIASALDYLHTPTPQRGTIVHRDIKPANILLSTSGAKLTDFGIALESDYTRYTVEGMVIGTDAYMAPELFTSGASLHGGAPEPTPSSDRYALALVALEMCTGVIMRDHYQPATWRGPRRFNLTGAPAEQVFARALGDDPSRRFPSATDFVEQLLAPSRAAAAPDPTHHAVASQPRPEKQPQERSSSRTRVLAGAGAVVLVGAVGLGAILLRPPTWDAGEDLIASALPRVVSARDGGDGWLDATCRKGDRDEGQEAKIVCRTDAEAFTVADYGSAEARDAHVDIAGAQRFSSDACTITSGAVPGTQVPTYAVLPDGDKARFAISLSGARADELRLSIPVC